MSQTLQEQRAQYTGISDYKRTARSRSNSQHIPEYTERVSSLPRYSRNLNATKLPQQNGFHSHQHFNDKSSNSTTHRRSTSFALDDYTGKRSTSMRRDSAAGRHIKPAVMTDILDEPRRNGGRLWTFYQNNRGLAYVLLAQIFGCLMNVTTRLLEIEGNRGEGMHPFQVCSSRPSRRSRTRSGSLHTSRYYSSAWLSRRH